MYDRFVIAYLASLAFGAAAYAAASLVGRVL